MQIPWVFLIFFFLTFDQTLTILLNLFITFIQQLFIFEILDFFFKKYYLPEKIVKPFNSVSILTGQMVIFLFKNEKFAIFIASKNIYFTFELLSIIAKKKMQGYENPELSLCIDIQYF